MKILRPPFDEGGKNVVLSSKDDNYSPKHENDNFYSKDNVLETIFTEANKYLQKGESSYSYEIPDPNESAHTFKDSNGRNNTFRITTLWAGRLALGCGSDIVMKELRRRCRELISNAIIQDIIKKYQELTRQLKDNANVNRFYQQIDTLWRSIYEDRELLKGKCDDCPKRRFEF